MYKYNPFFGHVVWEHGVRVFGRLAPVELTHVTADLLPVFTEVSTYKNFVVFVTIGVFIVIFALIPGGAKQPVSFSGVEQELLHMGSLVHSDYVLATVLGNPIYMV